MADAQRVLVAQPVDDDGLRRVRELLPGATVVCRDPIRPGEVLPVNEIEDVTVLFTDQCPANVEAMRRLSWVQLGSAGYQQLGGVPLPANVRVTNGSGVNDVPIAEWCLLMMLSAVRTFPDILRDQRTATYARPARYQAELRGSRVGIFGYGSIGREVARLSRSIGLEVWALSRSGFGPLVDRYQVPPVTPVDETPDRGFAPGELRDFLGGLDYLVVTAPLNRETAGYFGATELGWLPRHAVLLNPARAHIVDEQALLAALHDGTVAGAALDCHYREPMPADDPFWRAPNTVVTPHVSGSSASSHFAPRLWDLFAGNVERFVSGRPLLNEVSHEQIARTWSPS